jgi:hypothetical protein
MEERMRLDQRIAERFPRQWNYQQEIAEALGQDTLTLFKTAYPGDWYIAMAKMWVEDPPAPKAGR